MANSSKSVGIQVPDVLNQMDWFFKTISEILADSVIVLSSSMHVVYMNAAAEALFGYPAGDLIGKSLNILVPDQTRSSHQKSIKTFLLEPTASRQMGKNRMVYGRHQAGHLLPLDISISQHKWQNQTFVICVAHDITNQLTQHQALSESEQRYRGIIDTQNTLVVRVDRQGNFTFVNKAYCQMFGKTEEELIGQSFTPLVHPDDIAATMEAMKGLEHPPHRITVEQRAKTVKGWRWIAWEDHVIQDEIERKYEIQGVGHDISELKKAEEIATIERNMAIAMAEKFTLIDSLQVFLDLALLILDMDSGGIYLVDRLSGDLVLKAHKGLSEAFITQVSLIKNGSERHQLVMGGTPIYQDYLQTPLSKNKAAFDEEVRSFASIPILSNTKVVACLNVASHYKDGISDLRRKRFDGLAIQLGNMIERFQVQEDLLESQKQLQSLFDSLMDFIFVLDDQGAIVEVTQLVLDRLGYQREELLNKNVSEIHPPEQRQAALQIIQDMIAGVIDICPLDLLKKDGSTIPVETKVARGRWGNQDVLIGISRDITDRKAANTRLQEKKDEIEAFFTVSLDLLCIADLRGNFIRVNKAWKDILGYSVEELENRNFLDFVHPDDHQATLAEMSKLGSGTPTQNFVNRYQAKDRNWIYLEWCAQTKDNLIYAAASDITQRKMSEDIQESQTKLLIYRNAFEEILTSVSTLFINLPVSEIDFQINQTLKQIGEFEDVDRCYIFLIDQSAEYMNNTNEWCAAGVEPQIDFLQNLSVNNFPWWMRKLERLEEVHIPIVAQLPPEAQAEKEILEGQSIQSVLVVPMVANNHLIGFLGFDSVVKQRTWSHESILLIKMVADIFSNTLMHKQMENDLRRSEERNSALLGAIPDLIFRTRWDGVFLDYKASSADLLAVPPENIVGSSLQSVLSEPIGSQAMACIEKALQTGQVQTLEYTLTIEGSMHVFEARFNGCGLDEVIVIVRDISDQARLEQMKTDFINRATHELRTPIATMQLMTNLIDGETTEGEAAEYWSVLKSELGRERLLIESLLDAGRLDSNRTNYNFKPIDVIELIRRTLETLKPVVIDAHIELLFESQLELREEPYLVNADETSLTQVLINLVGNAIKFTPPGGKVTIRLQERDSGISISIVDTGIGIPAEDLPMLFTRFFRATNSIEKEIQGTGIGLFIVKSILEKHRGNIKVTSELDKGSEFVVWLPGL